MTFEPPFSGPLDLESTLKVGPSSILMTHLPGKSHVDQKGQFWTRNIQVDLKSLCEWGAIAVVCLVEKKRVKRVRSTKLL